MSKEQTTVNKGPEFVKAIVYTQYGTPNVLSLQEIEKPTPTDTQVLVQVHATSLNQADWHLLTADVFPTRLMGGFLKPKQHILGADISGRVQAIGTNVKQFQAGDAVFGDISGHRFGGLAEYVAVPENLLALKPKNISFEQAAAIPMAGVTALQGLRDHGHIQAGQNVLIYGASGGVGTFAVQIAKLFGAHVTAVCSTRNVEQARTLGADRVLDYTTQDFAQSGDQYDLILAANGYRPLAAYQRALKPNGTFVLSGGALKQIFQVMLLGPSLSRGGKTLKNLIAQPSQTDLQFLAAQMEAGKLSPVIDRRYPLRETAEAFRYLGQGHARGKVIVTMQDTAERISNG